MLVAVFTLLVITLAVLLRVNTDLRVQRNRLRLENFMLQRRIDDMTFEVERLKERGA